MLTQAGHFHAVPAKSFPINMNNLEKNSKLIQGTPTVYQSHLHPVNSFIVSLCSGATHLLSI